MAGEEGEDSTEARVRRGVARTLGNAVTVLVLLGLLGAWAYTGLYQLQPGQAAVVLRFGEHGYTEVREGLRWHWPAPIETEERVNIGSIRRAEFGAPLPEEKISASGEAQEGPTTEASMQTSDNNIVHLEFVVRYRIRDPFKALYRIADRGRTLRDSAQAAMREVVGRTPIDGVLSDQRGEVEAETAQLLQTILDDYETGLQVVGVQLQEVQPPDAVRGAFDDVIAALQDRSRKVNEAQGYANEVIPEARAQASEIVEEASGYRDAVVAEARGEAARFSAVLEEYRKAPEVTRTRLYIETMEAVLPDVEKVIVEPGTSTVVPYLPLREMRRGAEGAPAAGSGAAAAAGPGSASAGGEEGP